MIALFIFIIVVSVICLALAVLLGINTVGAWVDCDVPIVRTLCLAILVLGVVSGCIVSVQIGTSGPQVYQTQEYTITSMDPTSDTFLIVQKQEIASSRRYINYYYFHLDNSSQIGKIEVNSTHIQYSDEIEPSVWTYKEYWESEYRVLVIPPDTIIDIR